MAGLEVRPRTEADEARWTRFVSQSLCPTTRTGEQFLEPLWELYVASGYFNLAGKTTEHFDELRRSFLDLGQRAAQLPHLFCQTVWPSERGVEASLSSVQAPTAMAGWCTSSRGGPASRPAGSRCRGRFSATSTCARWSTPRGIRSSGGLFGYTESTVPWVYRTRALRPAAAGQRQRAW